MVLAIGPNHTDLDFPSGMFLNDKIEVFADRVIGWQIDIAQLCIDKSPHAGFAVLHIVVSYFEMIAKYEDGYIKDDASKRYFIRGVYSVFPDLRNELEADRFLKQLWEEVRCGLYHGGITGPNIELRGGLEPPIVFPPRNQRLTINPHTLVPAIKAHFQSYIMKLKDESNQKARGNFGLRFDRHREGVPGK
jgi:hypothetical protein